MSSHFNEPAIPQSKPLLCAVCTNSSNSASLLIVRTEPFSLFAVSIIAPAKPADLAKLLAHAEYLSQYSSRCTIVSGGGPFADQVRTAYQRWHLDERTAHQMAMLGMRQYGRLLASLSGLPICYSDHCGSEQCAIWLPTDYPMPACLSKIPPEQLDWDFTSDSISICLADYVGAEHLVLVKAISVDQANAFSELVDKRFIALMQDLSVKVICLSAEEWLQKNTSTLFA